MISMTKLSQMKNSLLSEQRAQARGFFSPRDLLGEQRAQAEAVFRLMIDSVIGLAILLVILSSLNYFQTQIEVQSKTDFINLIKNAVNSPTGFIFKSDELIFPNKFAVDSADLQSWTQISENCFKFDSRGGSIIVSSDLKKAEFNQKLKTIVYAQCNIVQGCDLRVIPDDWSACCTRCTVSFGKPILNE